MAEYVLAAVGPSPGSRYVLNTAAEMATAVGAELVACSVQTRGTAGQEPGTPLSQHAQHATDLGADYVYVHGRNVAKQILHIAWERNVRLIVVGRSPRSSRWLPWKEDIGLELLRYSGEVQIMVVPSLHADGGGTSGAAPFMPRWGTGLGAMVRMLMIMSVAVLLGVVIDRLSMRDANTIMVLLAGVLFTSTLGDRVTGLLSSVLAVTAFNFFFTDPRYTFVVADSSYLITFPVMLVVAFVTSELTTRLQLSAELARERQRRAEVLYRNSEQMISARTKTEIRDTAASNLRHLLQSPVSIVLDTAEQTAPTVPLSDEQHTSVSIATDETVFGHIDIDEAGGPLTPGQRALLNALAAQLAVALDRERLTQAEEQARIHAERERVRANLLRSVSHDLRTPLAAIAGAASALMDVTDIPATHAALPDNIYHDAMWLSEIVENILSLTRLNDSTLALRPSREVLEDIVLETVDRVRRRFDNRTIELRFPEEIIMVTVDVPLFEQMLTNVLANALDFSRTHEPVHVSVTSPTERSVTISVSDHGPGMDDEVRASAFNLFFTKKSGDDSRRGLGVGLTIAKTVADLHDGAIVLADVAPHGCEVRISLPATVASAAGEVM